MAAKINTVTTHFFAFDDEEVSIIINALHATDNSELAEQIWDELYGDCEECDCI